MAVENLTQNKDKKKVIEELDGIRKYLKSKSYLNSDSYAKWKEQAAVGNPDNSLLNVDKRHKVKRKKGKQHYQQLGSTRHISEWFGFLGYLIADSQFFNLF